MTCRSSGRLLSFTLACFALVAARPARADDMVQPPQLAAPQRASLAGEYGKVAFGPADVDRGGFNLPAPMHVPNERGSLSASVFPTYSPDSGISEWGIGWSTALTITRTRILGSLDYSTDDLSGPWGRMIRGSDGAYYAIDLGGRVRVDWQEPTIVATLPSGDRLTFGGDARFVTPRGTFSWYLTDVESLTGRRTHLSWSKNASGRLFLQTVQYGGLGQDYQYQLDFSYEATAYLFVSYLSGLEETLDQRIHQVTVRAKNVASGSFDERWHYTLGYLEEGMGPAFFLAEIDQTFAAGDAAPPVKYSYRLAATGLPTRTAQHVAGLDSILSLMGQDVIEPSRSTIFDYDDDGRPDLEESAANSVLQQTDKGWVTLPLPPMPAGASSLCRRAPLRQNLPRLLAEVMDGTDPTRVIGTQANATHSATEIDLCERDGRLVTRMSLNGYWAPSKNVKLVDLDRDRKPDLVRVDFGQLTILPNVSSAGGLAFDTARVSLLQPAFTPSATYVQDINGDGLPDLVARTSDTVTVWLGLGDFNFLTEGQTFELRAKNSLIVGSLDRFDFHFIDVNRDGLMDLLLTTATTAVLFANNGYYFQQIAMPAIDGLGSGISPPVVADLAGTGNAAVTFSYRSQAMAIDLDDAGVGLLASADDGRGNVLQFNYARGPASPGGMQRHSVLAGLTVVTTGTDPVSYAYGYQTPQVHSAGKFLLGYDTVVRSDPQSSQTLTLLNDDDAQDVLLSSVTAEALTPSLRSYTVQAYEATLYQNVPWLRLTSERHGHSDATGMQTLEERTDYLAYTAEVCPSQVRVTKEVGTLTTVTTRAEPAELANALHCLVEWSTLTGQHGDSRWNFVEQKHHVRNDLGLVKSIESVAADGALTLQTVGYNPDWTIASLTQPGRGTTTFAYDPTTHLLTTVNLPDGTVIGAQRSPLTDSLQTLLTDRGGSAFSQYFRFDGQERLVKSWDSLGLSSEAQPNEQVGYRYATATVPATTTLATLIDAGSGSVQHTVQWSTGSGDSLAKASLIPEGWSFESLVRRFPNKGEATTSARPTVAVADPTAFAMPTLFAGAQTLSDTVTAPSGTMISALTWFHADVQQQLTGSAALAGHLVEQQWENGTYGTSHTFDAGKRPIAFTDQAGATWRYHYDALDRLRAIDLPDGSGHRSFYDGHGRLARVERDGIAIVGSSYDLATGLQTGQTYYAPDGTPIRGTSWSYDGAGRKLREVATDLQRGATSSYSFYYDGATPEQPAATTMRGLLTAVSGDGFVKEMSYRPDGKLTTRTVSFPGWRTVTTQLDYAADGAPRSTTTQVLQDGAVVDDATQLDHFDPYGRLIGVDVGGMPLQLSYDGTDQLIGATLAGSSTVSVERDGLTRAAVALTENTPGWQSVDRFRRNPRGLVGSETIGVGDQPLSRQYGYSAQRFLSSATDEQASLSYQYDPSGSPTDIVEEGVERTVSSAAGRWTAGATAYGLDSIGRVTSVGDLELGYGPDGQLASAARGGRSWQFVYDENGQRLLKRTGGVPVAAYIEEGYLDGSGLVQPFAVQGITLGVIRGGQLMLQPLDLRGTVIGDDDGTPRAASPFGNRAAHPELAAAIDYVHKGYDADLGFVRMGARDYDPSLGRFLTPDLLFLTALDKSVASPVESNLYSYARNAPLDFADPSGHGSAAFEARAFIQSRGKDPDVEMNKPMRSGEKRMWAVLITAPLACFVPPPVWTVLGMMALTQVKSSDDFPGMMKAFFFFIGGAGGRIPARAAASAPVPTVAAAEIAPIVTFPGEAFQGTAVQNTTSAAMAAREQVQAGATLWRVGTMGKSFGADGQFWSLEWPLNPGYPGRYGMPPENVLKANFIESATLKEGASFVTRQAPPSLDGVNPGGGIEAVVDPGGVNMKGFSARPDGLGNGE
jgi:RHS repeat-associated protein